MGRAQEVLKQSQTAKYSQNKIAKKVLLDTKDAKLQHYVRGKPPTVLNDIMKVRSILEKQEKKHRKKHRSNYYINIIKTIFIYYNMKLSPISQNLMKEILKQFDTLALPRTQYERRMIDNTFKILYNDIKRADTHIENLLTQHKIKSHIVEFKTGKVVPMTTLFNSHFVNDLARKYVVQHLKGYLIFEVELEGHKIELYFALLKPEDFIKSYRFEKYMKQMFMWLYLAALYSPNHCAENLKIFCFLTPFRKKIPRNQYSILSPDHCNSAVTTSCTKNGEIVIFREEEICKVLIHESFHVFGLDFSNLPTNKINNKMVKIFPIESEFNLFEAYSETWASILNSLFFRVWFIR